MRTFLLVLLILCGAYGAFMAANALSIGTSAIHEIEALIGVLILTVAAGAGYVASEKK